MIILLHLYKINYMKHNTYTRLVLRHTNVPFAPVEVIDPAVFLYPYRGVPSAAIREVEEGSRHIRDLVGQTALKCKFCVSADSKH